MSKLPGMLFLIGLVMLAMGVTLFFISFQSKVVWLLTTVLFYGGGSLAVIGASVHLIKE